MYVLTIYDFSHINNVLFVLHIYSYAKLSIERFSHNKKPYLHAVFHAAYKIGHTYFAIILVIFYFLMV